MLVVEILQNILPNYLWNVADLEQNSWRTLLCGHALIFGLKVGKFWSQEEEGQLITAVVHHLCSSAEFAKMTSMKFVFAFHLITVK